jgi:hypothetical protein
MLTNIGILASGKGMVSVPNILGLSEAAAISALNNVELIPVDGGTTPTENSALNNTIASQVPNAGELVNYETQVTYTRFTFVAPPPFFPFFPFFPTFTPAVTYYCTSTFVDQLSFDIVCVNLEPSSTDQSGSQCDSFAVVCSTTSYPSCPSIPTCTPPDTTPFFPFFPTFTPPPSGCSPATGSFIRREIYTEPSGDCYIDYCVGPEPSCGEVQCGGGCF